MKVLLINGSSNQTGCTYTALSEIVKVFDAEEIDSEIIQLGNDPIRDCCACWGCRQLDNQCIFDDDIVNKILNKAKEADGFIFGSPVYYAHPSGRILSVLDRVFYAGSRVFKNKPGAAIVSGRRGGTTASFDVLNKYFSISKMPIVTSQYWNMVHGNTPDEVMQDMEGLQTMRTLAKNMVWLLKCIEAGKKAGVQAPDIEKVIRTNFIR